MAEKGSKTKKPQTRHDAHDQIVGTPSELPERVLPTYGDVLRAVRLKRFSKLKKGEKEPSINDLAQEVAEELVHIWKTASIPTITTLRIRERMKEFHCKYTKLKAYPDSQRQSDSYAKKVSAFQDHCLMLFDVASCKCNLDDPTAISRCSCAKKIPSREHNFLLDQRGPRKMAIGGIDIATSVLLKRKLERQQRQAEFTKKFVSESQVVKQYSYDIYDGEQEIADCDTSDPSYSPCVAVQTDQSNQMRVHLPSTAKVADRFGLSHTAVAALASSILKDVGLISPENKTMVIDRSKIQRERVRIRQQSQKDDAKGSALLGLYFDGKKDPTLLQEKIGKKYHRRTIMEEHISLVEEPGSKYIGHVTPESGTGGGIASSILSFCESQGISLDHLLVIGSDGTIVNTGYRGGVISLIERRLGRNLQWQICLLHFNELPLRHLFMFLDGQTTGPNTFAGPIGNMLADCEKKPIVKFRKIKAQLPDIDSTDLSTDQKYLLEMCRAISDGSVPDDLAHRYPGRLNHSRWVTAGNRILRLYVATSQPNANLVTITKYVINVYARLWFSIKKDWKIAYASMHTWKAIEYSRYLPIRVRAKIDATIQKNAFSLHPENLLVAMLFDERQGIRQLAVTRILQARASKDASNFRQFHIPKLNTTATDYVDVIDWDMVKVTPPPLLKNLSNDELQMAVVDPTAFQSLQLWQFPCHTQVVERTVKLVTAASSSVCGFTNRDGMIRNTLQSRSEMPRFTTKSEFLPKGKQPRT